MSKEHKAQTFYVYEVLLIVAGIFFLISAAVLASGGTSILWFVAKVVYALGVLVLLFNR